MLIEILNKYDRIIVVGFPKVGKTKICQQIKDREVIHTDEFIEKIAWKDQAEFIINQIKDKEKYIVEGVQCFRVLRTGLKDKLYKPDVIVYIEPVNFPIKKHVAMRKTLTKIWMDFLILNKQEKIPIIYLKGVP